MPEKLTKNESKITEKKVTTKKLNDPSIKKTFTKQRPETASSLYFSYTFLIAGISLTALNAILAFVYLLKVSNDSGFVSINDAPTMWHTKAAFRKRTEN